MKKLISAIIVVCLLLTAFSTIVAADRTDITISSVTYTSSGTYFNITVNGECEQGNNVSVRIKNKNGDLKALKQFKVKNSDTYSYDIKINTAGDETLTEADGSLTYTLYVRNSNNQSDTYSLPLYTEASKLDIVSKFNGTSDALIMQGYIETYSRVFGFDFKYYAGREAEIAKYLIKVKNVTPLTLDNIVGSYNEAVIRAYLFAEDKAADRTEIIEYPDYSAMLQFETGIDGAKSLYPDYKAVDSEKAVNEIAFTEENSMVEFSTLKEKFFMAVTETVFAENKEDSEEIYKFLKDHNDWLELENLENLKTYDAYQIISKIVGEDIPDNKADMVDLYNEIYEEVCKEEPVKKPATGGGGGSSGGGFSGIAGGNSGEETGYEKPEAPVEIKPIETVSFNDIDGYEWAKDAIEALATKGIVNGKADGVFAPTDNITREEFAKILSLAYDLYDEDVKCDFADVGEDRWSYKYIAIMYENGIITGYPDGTFKPGSIVTREEMAVMLCRVLVKLSIITEEYETYSSYKDYGEISAFAQNSVRTLSNNNILSGDDKGCFNPKNGATRAEVCKMIYNTGL